MGKWWENHGKIMGKLGKSWENGGKKHGGEWQTLGRSIWDGKMMDATWLNSKSVAGFHCPADTFGIQPMHPSFGCLHSTSFNQRMGNVAGFQMAVYKWFESDWKVDVFQPQTNRSQW